MTDETNRESARIRELNDAIRKGDHAAPGASNSTVLMTQGVSAKGMEFMLKTSRVVMDFDAFTPDNDPHGERDFGAVEIDGETIFWKIDAYDLSLTYGSPDPADPEVTHRVLTIMLASEY